MVFTANKPKAAGQILLIDIDKISPNRNQPRENFTSDDLMILSRSIRENGIIQPLTVRKKGDGYELIAGERRLRASKLANLKCVPCIVMEVDDKSSAVFALIENLQRQQLDFIEEAKAIQTLASYYGMRQDEIASSLGKTQSAVSNLLRLLRLSPEIQQKLINNNLTQRHARALLKLSSHKQSEVIDIIVKKKLNVAQTEKLVESICAEEEKPHRKRKLFFGDVKIFINTINHAIETMQSAGIDAHVEKKESDSSYTFTVTVPKKR